MDWLAYRTRVGDFPRIGGPQLIGTKRHDGDGIAAQGNKLDFVALAAVDQHNRAYISRVKSEFRQVCRKHTAIQFIHRIEALITRSVSQDTP
jgi:hypothetical protein